MTPSRNAGPFGTRVMGGTRMISRTRWTGMPYDSSPTSRTTICSSDGTAFSWTFLVGSSAFGAGAVESCETAVGETGASLGGATDGVTDATRLAIATAAGPLPLVYEVPPF